MFGFVGFRKRKTKRKITKIAWLEMLIKTDFHWYCALRKTREKMSESLSLTHGENRLFELL